MCAELVEEVFTSLPLTYADEKPKRVPLLKAVDFDGMIVGTTHWAKQVPLHGWVAGIGEDDEEAFGGGGDGPEVVSMHEDKHLGEGAHAEFAENDEGRAPGHE